MRYKTPVPPVPCPTDPGAMIISLSRGYIALVSNDDAEDVGKYNWFVKVDTHTSYARRTVTGQDGRRHTQSLHRFIGARMGLSLDRHMDHINHDGLDCRRENLRAATPQESMWNLRRSRLNTSGVKGVFYDKRVSKWCGRFKINKRLIHVGVFATQDEAARVTSEARKALQGAFAHDG